MDKNKILELILVEWIASLNSKDRSGKFVRSNFEELFEKWQSNDASFDDLYETLLPKAIKAHKPSSFIARNTFKKLKNVANLDKTEKEFIDDWNASIEATGTEAFFEYFPATAIDHDPEPKIYGNMSATEYRAQRKYIEQFPTLHTDDLIKQWKKQVEYHLNIDDALDTVLGGDNETNE